MDQIDRLPSSIKSLVLLEEYTEQVKRKASVNSVKDYARYRNKLSVIDDLLLKAEDFKEKSLESEQKTQEVMINQFRSISYLLFHVLP